MSIPLYKPLISSAAEAGVQDVLKRGLLTQGSVVKNFEQQFADTVGASYAVAVNSGTAALHVALAAMGVQPSDEVIVPAFTWVSTAHAVEYLGATPVFCDIDRETFNINPQNIRARINSRTVGVVPVHLFGLPADMDSIWEIANEHNLWVIEDAAGALGASYKGKSIGALSEITCFSFHPRKIITTGEGGMITTNDGDLAEKMNEIRQLGAPHFSTIGYNYRLNELQAALGLAQLEYVQEILIRKQAQAKVYNDLLSASPFISTPAVSPDIVHSYQAYVCLLDPAHSVQRDAIMDRLAEGGITTRPGTHAPPFLPYYADTYSYTAKDFPNALVAAEQSLALPLFHDLLAEQQEFIADRLLEVITNERITV